MIRVSGINISLNDSKEELKNSIKKKLKLSDKDKFGINICRKSIDARKKDNVHYVYTVDVDLNNPAKEAKLLSKKLPGISKTKTIKYKFPYKATDFSNTRPVITGAGPCGLFCALMLARAGFKPIIIERGKSVEERTRDVENFFKTGVLDTESNVQFGEGGAGAFSDGKLNTSVNDSDGRNTFVLKEFVKNGADESIIYDHHPHIGTDVLVGVIANIRNEIISRGGEFLYNTKLVDFKDNNGSLDISIESDGGIKTINTNALILAIGHSARDTFFKLHENGIDMEKKPFAVGLRIQHPQKLIDMSMYGEKALEFPLPPSPYKLTGKTPAGRPVYSFCMCPGGYVVNASSEEGMLAVNGMSYSKRDSEYANSALVVAVNPEDYEDKGVLSGICFQRDLERKAFELAKGKIPVETYVDFKNKTLTDDDSCIKGCFKGQCAYAPVHEILPDFLYESLTFAISDFGHKIKGFDDDNAMLSAIESRTSSSVRIIRDEDGHSNIKGIFPAGEGAGYAGGITSAAIDGIKTAEKAAYYLLNLN